MWYTYIGNTHLESKTLDKVYIIEGTEFCYRGIHIIVFSKALYGTRYSGLRWNKRFAGCIIDMI